MTMGWWVGPCPKTVGVDGVADIDDPSQWARQTEKKEAKLNVGTGQWESTWP